MKTNNLIEALEKAEGSCRELDVAIAHKLAWQPSSGLLDHAKIDWRKPYSEIIRLSETTLRGPNPYAKIPRWTSSIDAALTLVPDGLHWGVGKVSETSYIAKIWADKKTGYIAEVMASSPSLSLSAAALRSMGDDDEG